VWPSQAMRDGWVRALIVEDVLEDVVRVPSGARVPVNCLVTMVGMMAAPVIAVSARVVSGTDEQP
jgi:hypothetical protein